jgi:hypothetical protein
MLLGMGYNPLVLRIDWICPGGSHHTVTLADGIQGGGNQVSPAQRVPPGSSSS